MSSLVSDGMAAGKIIPFAAFEGRKSTRASAQGHAPTRRMVVDLRQARIARALDAVNCGHLQEDKAPRVAVGAELAEYRRQIRAGGFRFDAEELAASILDSLLPPSK